MLRLWHSILTALALAFFLLLPCSAQEPESKNTGAPVITRKTVTASKNEPAPSEDFVVAKVKHVSEPKLNDSLKNSTGIVSRFQLVEMEIMEGPLKGKKVQAINEITDNPSFNIKVEPGKELILSVISDQSGASEFNIADNHRAPVIYALTAAFLAAFFYFGGRSAFKSLLGLIIAIALIGFVLLPLSMRGFNPLISSALICFLAGSVTIFCVGGFSRKSSAALIGTIGGVIVAGIASYLAIEAAPLTGLSSEEAQILRANMGQQGPGFFPGLLAASMLIGALGVIMDVGISIASSVWELAKTDELLKAKELYAKGMNVGRDIMGSMTCTLVLAYAGSALPLLMLMSSMPSLKLLNLDLVAGELAAALTGSLGLVCTIPLTAFAAAHLMAGGNSRVLPAGKTGKADLFKSLDDQSSLLGFKNQNELTAAERPDQTNGQAELADKRSRGNAFSR